MGIVYGRMNSNQPDRVTGVHHTSCSPSKVKPTCRSNKRCSIDDGNSSDHSDSLPTPRVTRQASRNLLNRQRELALRRSARLRSGQVSRGGSAGSAANELRAPGLQPRLRRSARLARTGLRARGGSGRGGVARATLGGVGSSIGPAGRNQQVRRRLHMQLRSRRQSS